MGRALPTGGHRGPEFPSAHALHNPTFEVLRLGLRSDPDNDTSMPRQAHEYMRDSPYLTAFVTRPSLDLEGRNRSRNPRTGFQHSVCRDPKHVDGLIFFGTPGGLRLLPPIGNSHEGVRRQPGNTFDIAVPLVREAIDDA